MKLVMTLLARDEADILAANIDFHLTQGVDFVIATDNRSEDQTTAILRGYEARGVLRYLFESGDDYDQGRWVTRMARLAHDEHGAGWVINNDADEFWWPRHGSLKSVLQAQPSGVAALRAERYNFSLVEGTGEFHRRMIYRECRTFNDFGLPLPPKIAHRASATAAVAMTLASAIPVCRPLLPTADQLLPYLRRIDAARWYTNFGPWKGPGLRSAG